MPDNVTNQPQDRLSEIMAKDSTPVSYFGIYVTLSVFLLIIVLFATISRFISKELESTEIQRLAIESESISIFIDNNLTHLADDLNTLTKLDGAQHCTFVRHIAQRHPFLLDVMIVTEDGIVSQNCPTRNALGDLRYQLNEKIRERATLSAIFRSSLTNSPAYSVPYMSALGSGPFADLAIPFSGNSAILARISLAAVLRMGQDHVKTSGRQTEFVINGRAIDEVLDSEAADQQSAQGVLRTFSPVPPLPYGVSIEHSTVRQSPFEENSYLVWTILILTSFLIITVLSILRFQYRQIMIESELRGRAMLHSALTSNIKAAFCIIDLHGKILYVNDFFYTFFGFDVEQDAARIIGISPPYPFYSPSNNPTAKPLQEVTDEKGEVTTREFIARSNKNNSTFDCSESRYELKDTHKRTVGWFIVYTDVTVERRNKREALLATERITRVLETIDAAVSVTTDEAEPKLLFANARYTEPFGNDARMHVTLREAIRQTIAARTTKLKETPVTDSGSVEHAELYENGTRRWLAVSMKKIEWIDGNAAQLMTINDVTDRKENEARLDQQMKAAEQSSHLITMGEMTSSMAHELNQPLGAIKNYASGGLMMLQNNKLTEKTVGELLTKIVNQTERAATVMSRIRGFAQRSEVTMTTALVSTIISETMELANIQAKKHDMRVEVSVQEDIPALCCDTVLIEQVLLNLLRNAMEASHDTGCKTVWLSVTSIGSFVHFNVADHGTGIAPDVRNKLFEPFFSTKKDGMGIGLNICRSMVESHHGKLTISDNEGGGTVFTVTLPAPVSGLES